MFRTLYSGLRCLVGLSISTDVAIEIHVMKEDPDESPLAAESRASFHDHVTCVDQDVVERTELLPRGDDLGLEVVGGIVVECPKVFVPRVFQEGLDFGEMRQGVLLKVLVIWLR